MIRASANSGREREFGLAGWFIGFYEAKLLGWWTAERLKQLGCPDVSTVIEYYDAAVEAVFGYEYESIKLSDAIRFTLRLRQYVGAKTQPSNRSKPEQKTHGSARDDEVESDS